MNYEQYVKHQTLSSGMAKKPLHYRKGERRAIGYFFYYIPRNSIILDVGCGSGTGMVHLQRLGFMNMAGIELNLNKAIMCRRKKLDVIVGDAENLRFPFKFDIVWSSHSFEHMLRPALVLENLKAQTTQSAQFFFILPYPDTGPKEVHCASDTIGTRIDDNGKTVMDWFYHRGLETTEVVFDNYRENEIWLKLKKRD